MNPRLRLPIALAALTIEAVIIARLVVLLLPFGPVSFQQSAFYSAFLTGDEASVPAVVLVPLAGSLALGALLAIAARYALRTIRARHEYQASRPTAGNDHQLAPRFDLHQRTQHLLLLSCVGMLALTGIPQELPDDSARAALLMLFGGEAAARTTHRVAATVLDFAVLYHLGYLIARGLHGRHWPTTLLPAWRGFPASPRRQPSIGARHDTQPRGFTSSQKLDYWVAAACTPAMTLSGLVLVHPDLAQQYLPAASIALAAVLHRTIALTFVAYVLAVHFYHVLWSAEVFPFSPAMFTGRVRVARPPTVAASQPQTLPAPKIVEQVRG